MDTVELWSMINEISTFFLALKQFQLWKSFSHKVKLNSAFTGPDQVNGKLNAFIQKIKESRSSDISRYLEEFKTIFKYLAFVACAAKAPIKQKLLDYTLGLIDKAGSA